MENKVVLVYVRGPGEALQNGIHVFDPKLQNIQGTKYLVGKTPEPTPEWISGLPIIVAWEEVIHVVIFDSIEDYLSRLEKSFTDQSSSKKSNIQ